VIAVLTGEISEGDTDKLRLLLKNTNDQGKIVSGVRLNSGGGSLIEGLRLAATIRDAKMATVVTAGSTCASACFIAFAGGVEKYVSYSATVGVHGASEKVGRQTGDSNSGTILMAKAVKDLGVPPGIIGKMVVTPFEQIVWLSPDDLRSMGTTMTGKQTQSYTATAPSQLPNQPITVPSSQANTKASLSWGDLVNSSAELSSSQNGGKPLFSRVCQPEMKVCNTALSFKSAAGVDMMLRTSEDMNGKLMEREVCEFNTFRDVRLCVNFDTHVASRDMKNAKGEWYKVGDN